MNVTCLDKQTRELPYSACLLSWPVGDNIFVNGKILSVTQLPLGHSHQGFVMLLLIY